MESRLAGATGSPRAPKLLCIDLLRGLAALAVVLHHAHGFFWGLHGPYHPAWAFRLSHATLGHCDLGVELFFVISGFCIHLPNATAERLGPREFLVRRFFRIYPAYIAVVLLCFALAAAQSNLGLGPRVHAHHLLLNLVGHALFWLYSFGPRGTASPVLWTLALEAQFYLVYLLVFPMLRRIGFGRAAVTWLIADAAYAIAFSSLHLAPAGPLWTFAPQVFPITRFGEWLLGAWLADRVVLGRRDPGPACQPAALIALAAGLLLAAIAGLSVPALSSDVFPLVSLAFMVLIAGMVRREARLARLVGPTELGAVARWLSSRSYSIYLIHYTVIAAVGLVLARLSHVADRDAVRGTPRWLLVTVVGVVAAFAAASMLYRLVEAPSHRLARRLSQRAAARHAAAELPVEDPVEAAGA